MSLRVPKRVLAVAVLFPLSSQLSSCAHVPETFMALGEQEVPQGEGQSHGVAQ